MNMKKFLTVLILCLAAFAVSCSDDDTGTNPITYDVTSAQLSALVAAINNDATLTVDKGDISSIDTVAEVQALVKAAYNTELGNVAGTGENTDLSDYLKDISDEATEVSVRLTLLVITQALV